MMSIIIAILCGGCDISFRDLVCLIRRVLTPAGEEEVLISFLQNICSRLLQKDEQDLGL